MPTPGFPQFYYMLGANLGVLLYGEVSVMFRLIIDYSLKLLHAEIVSLWIKTVVNVSQCLKPCLRQLLKIFIGDLFGLLLRVRDKNFW